MILRICFCKGDRLRFLSHLNLMNTMVRAMRRAHIPFAFSKGFNPRPRLAMGPPLPVGLIGLREYMDVELAGDLTPDGFSNALSGVLPRGLSLVQVDWVEKGPSLMAFLDTACYSIPFLTLQERDWEKEFSSLLAGGPLWIERKKKGREQRIDVVPLLRRFELVCSNGRLEVSLYVRTGSKGTVRPQEILQIIPAHIGHLQAPSLIAIKRIGLFYEQEGRFLPPL